MSTYTCPGVSCGVAVGEVHSLICEYRPEGTLRAALSRKDAALRGLPEMLEWAAAQLDDGGDDGPSIRTAKKLNAKAEELRRALASEPNEGGDDG